MSVFIGGIIQNGVKFIPTIKRFIAAFHEEIPDAQIFFFENNSTDATAEKLRSMAESTRNFYVKCETWDMQRFGERGRARASDNKPCRIELIASARNALLDMIESKCPYPDDKIVMIDWDFLIPPLIRPLIKWIRDFPTEIDGIFANGIDLGGNYYDLYEIRTDKFPYGPELIGDSFWKSKKRLRSLSQRISLDSQPAPVISAFGGLAVYRASSLIGSRYSAVPTISLHDYYKERVFSSPPGSFLTWREKRRLVTHYDGAALGTFLFGDGIFYRANSGYNYPIAAEHVNLHLDMRARGRGNFVIAPDMVYHHQG